MVQEILLLKTIILVLTCCLSLNGLLAAAEAFQQRREKIRINKAMQGFKPLQALIRSAK